MTIDMTAIICSIIAILGAVLTGIVVPYIKSKTTISQRENILGLIGIAVQAAEQLHQITDMGDIKREYVLTWLNEHGVDTSNSDIKDMIEAQVYALINSWQ